MARNFNMRRNAINYADNIRDGGDRLREILAGRHFIDRNSVNQLMNQLSELSLANVQSAIEKADKTITAAETQREILLNAKKLKETQRKLVHKDEVASMKMEQADRNKQTLDRKMNIGGLWIQRQPADGDDDDDDGMDQADPPAASGPGA